ncbi:hypothetical protein FOCC_FOCC012401 [Frankliniella occidentalis]|nr:hypothetical protein FOCC_FOCC012401 [Frankliniella occidentalis]
MAEACRTKNPHHPTARLLTEISDCDEKDFQQLDKMLKKEIKATMHLPQRASAEIVSLPPSWGGAGILPISDLIDLCIISHAFRLLTSPDPVIEKLALHCLTAAVHRKVLSPDNNTIAAYLSGSRENGLHRDGGDFGHLWSAARTASNKIKKLLPGFDWGSSEERSSFEIKIPGDVSPTIIDSAGRKVISKNMRLAAQRSYLKKLTSNPDQGRVFGTTSACPTSNFFMSTFKYIRFCDWRTIYRLRLNVPSLNACRKWDKHGNKKCRRCGQHDETTAPELNHCLPAMPHITARHNSVLKRLSDLATKFNPNFETRRDLIPSPGKSFR